MIPVLFGRSEEHRRAIRSAGGANLDAEAATAAAQAVLVLACLAAVLVAALT